MASGANLYTYVRGDPISWIDPLGLEPDVFKGVITFESGQINVFDRSGNAISGAATSGGFGKGALPQGIYQTKGPVSNVPTDRRGFCDRADNCWWQPISPIGGYPTLSGHESGLGIHPDGRDPGTSGCIGVGGSNTSLVEDALRRLRVGLPVLVY